MLILLRQGKISKWFSGIGQEAISVGVGLALDFEEYILPLHRNLGVFTTKNVPLNRLFFDILKLIDKILIKVSPNFFCLGRRIVLVKK